MSIRDDWRFDHLTRHGGVRDPLRGRSDRDTPFLRPEDREDHTRQIEESLGHPYIRGAAYAALLTAGAYLGLKHFPSSHVRRATRDIGHHLSDLTKRKMGPTWYERVRRMFGRSGATDIRAGIARGITDPDLARDLRFAQELFSARAGYVGNREAAISSLMSRYAASGPFHTPLPAEMPVQVRNLVSLPGFQQTAARMGMRPEIVARQLSAAAAHPVRQTFGEVIKGIARSVRFPFTQWRPLELMLPTEMLGRGPALALLDPKNLPSPEGMAGGLFAGGKLFPITSAKVGGRTIKTIGRVPQAEGYRLGLIASGMGRGAAARMGATIGRPLSEILTEYPELGVPLKPGQSIFSVFTQRRLPLMNRFERFALEMGERYGIGPQYSPRVPFGGRIGQVLGAVTAAGKRRGLEFPRLRGEPAWSTTPEGAFLRRMLAAAGIGKIGRVRSAADLSRTERLGLWLGLEPKRAIQRVVGGETIYERAAAARLVGRGGERLKETRRLTQKALRGTVDDRGWPVVAPPKFYAYKSARQGLSDWVNYHLNRPLWLMQEMTGMSLKPGKTPAESLWKIGSRIALPAYFGWQALQYAEYKSRRYMGFGPISGPAMVYTRARLEAQKMLDSAGITEAAEELEEKFPGMVESPFSKAAMLGGTAYGGTFIGQRVAGAKGAAIGLAAGLVAGLAYATGITTPAQELREMYEGERDVPVRAGRWWTLGRSSFAGCLTSDSEVICDTLPVPISLVGSGSVTNRALDSRVSATSKRMYKGPVRAIRTMFDSSSTIRLTPLHLVLAIPYVVCHKFKETACRPTRRWYRCDGCTHRVPFEPQWIPAMDLKPGDWAVFPMPKRRVTLTEIDCSEHLPSEWVWRDDVWYDGNKRAEEDAKVLAGRGQELGLSKRQVRYRKSDVRQRNKRQTGDPTKYWGRACGPGPRSIPLDFEFGRLAGYFLAEGCLGVNTTAFCFHEKETTFHSEVASSCIHYLKKPVKKERSSEHGIVLLMHSGAVNKILRSIFVRDGEKVIPPAFIQRAPKEFLLGMIDGMFMGDSSGKSTASCLGLASRTLVKQFQTILLSLGMASRMSLAENRPSVDSDRVFDRFDLHINGESYVRLVEMTGRAKAPNTPPSKLNGSVFIVEDFVCAKVISNEEEEYDGLVHDIETDKFPGFLTPTLFVHNSRIKYHKKHWFAEMMSDYKSKAIYGSRKEAWRSSWLPTPENWMLLKNIWDPYYVENRNWYERPYPTTSGLGEEIPLIGPIVGATIGKLLKPTRYRRVDFPDAQGLPHEVMRGQAEAVAMGIPAYPIEKPIPRVKWTMSQLTGETLHRLFDWTGLPGFAISALKENITGRPGWFEGEELLAASGDITSPERDYYDRNLGGLLGMTELRRRFTPRRRRNAMFNPIRNVAPEWLPGSRSAWPGDREGYLNFSVGDPYCVGPNTPINVPCGYESAQDIEVGNLIMTHTGRYLPVRAVAKRQLRDGEKAYRVRVSGVGAFIELVFSEEHPLYIKRTEYCSFASSALCRPIRNLKGFCDRKLRPEPKPPGPGHPRGCKASWYHTDPQFRRICECAPGDYLVYKIPERHVQASVRYEWLECVNSYRSRYVVREGTMNLTTEIAWIFGLYIAEGYTTAPKGRHPTQLAFSMSSDEVPVLAKVNDLLEKYMGVRGTITVDNGSADLVVSSTRAARIFNYLMPGDSHTKTVPQFMFNASSDVIWSFVCGMILGDGGVSQNSITYTTASRDLAFGLRRLCFCIMIPMGIDKRVRKDPRLKAGFSVSYLNRTHAVHVWGLDLSGLDYKAPLLKFNSDRLPPVDNFTDGEFVYQRIIAIEEVNVDAVFGFQVDADNSFCVLDFATHNTLLAKGEARLPGPGYEALHELRSGEPGVYDSFDRFKILCVLPNTPIITPDGPVPIEHCKDGVVVLTDEGKWARAKVVRREKSEGSVRVTAYYDTAYPLECFETHYVRTSAGYKHAGDLVRDNEIAYPIRRGPARMIVDGTLCLPAWIIPNLKPYVTDQRLMVRAKGSQTGFLAHVPLNVQFGRVCGLYLAEGCVSGTTLYFSLHAAETHLRDEIIDWIRLVAPDTPYSWEVKGNSGRLMVWSKSLCELFANLFGSDAASKFVDDILFGEDVPEPYMLGLIGGFFDGDGYFGPVGKRGFEARHSTIARRLAIDLRHMGFRVKIVLGLRFVDRRGQVSMSPDGREIWVKHVSWVSYVPKACLRRLQPYFRKAEGAKIPRARVAHFRFSDDYALIKIRKVERVAYSGDAWDLHVPDGSSFCTPTFCTHNSDVAPFSDAFKHYRKVVQSQVESRALSEADTKRFYRVLKQRQERIESATGRGKRYGSGAFATHEVTMARILSPTTFQVHEMPAATFRLAGVKGHTPDMDATQLREYGRLGSQMRRLMGERVQMTWGGPGPLTPAIVDGLNRTAIEGGIEADRLSDLGYRAKHGGGGLPAMWEDLMGVRLPGPLDYPRVKWMGARTPAEMYEQYQVHGTADTNWSHPFQNYIIPWFHQTVGGMPAQNRRAREIANYMDHLKYVKSRQLEQHATTAGNAQLAQTYHGRAGQTIVSLRGSQPNFWRDVYAAMPPMEKPYFSVFAGTSGEEERERIMDAVPEYMRHIYMGAWKRTTPGGTFDSPILRRYANQAEKMSKEDPSVRVAEFFSQYPMPPKDFLGWHPGIDLETITIKTARKEAVNIHQLGLWEAQALESERMFPYVEGIQLDEGGQWEIRDDIMDELHRNGFTNLDYQPIYGEDEETHLRFRKRRFGRRTRMAFDAASYTGATW